MKKYFIGISVAVAAVFAFIALLPLQAFFTGNEDVQKLSDGEKASIEVELPQAHGEKISSLQLSLAVANQDGSAADADILQKVEDLSFVPDKAVSSKTEIWEQRYHEDTGILDIYIAGTEPLFSEEDKLAVGTVTAELNGSGDVYVKVADDSFKVVKGVSLENITDEQDAVVRISAAGTSAVATESPKPTENVSPSSTITPNLPQDAANPMNDNSKLLSALEMAATLQESDYTSDSFTLLKKAVEAARAVLNNPNATQEEVDQAADAIYNAMGTLVRSGGTSADNYEASKTQNKGTTLKEAAPTGDSNSILLYMIVLVLNIGILAATIIWKMRRNSSKKTIL